MMNKGYILSEQSTLFGGREVIGFGGDGFCVKEIQRDVANSVIKENHYSKKFYSASYIHLGVFTDRLLGVLQLGYAMNPASQCGVVADTKIDEYLELNRMWLDDELPRNSESMAISYAIKYIKKKYPKISWIQSFADERCGCLGVVYQAANFLYCGEHSATFWEYEGTFYHNIIMTAKLGKQGPAGIVLQNNKDKATKHVLRQFRYIYFIKRFAKKNLLLKTEQYPKRAAI